MPRAPTDSLDDLITPARGADGRYEADIPDGWQQGRGAFGGIVLGLLARAAEGSLAEPLALRSITAELCGPVLPGPVAIATETLRAGHNVTTVAARLAQDETVLAHAVCVLARERPGTGEGLWMTPPAQPRFAATPEVSLAVPGAPRFARYFEYHIEGPLPFSGARAPSAQGWIRPRRPGARRDAAYLVACVDAWYPSFFATETSPRPVGTIAFTAQVVGSTAGLAADAPLAYRAGTLVQHDGYAVEHRELWTEDGRLLILNQQTIAIIR